MLEISEKGWIFKCYLPTIIWGVG